VHSLPSSYTPQLTKDSALAGKNCKCQDDKGQYNGLTEQVCQLMKQDLAASDNKQVMGLGSLVSMFTADARYHGDQHHQVCLFCHFIRSSIMILDGG
jgi:hypothetical protein